MPFTHNPYHVSLHTCDRSVLTRSVRSRARASAADSAFSAAATFLAASSTPACERPASARAACCSSCDTKVWGNLCECHAQVNGHLSDPLVRNVGLTPPPQCLLPNTPGYGSCTLSILPPTQIEPCIPRYDKLDPPSR